jgi:hypothetical protein
MVPHGTFASFYHVTAPSASYTFLLRLSHFYRLLYNRSRIVNSSNFLFVHYLLYPAFHVFSVISNDRI